MTTLEPPRKVFDLEERTQRFAANVRSFVAKVVQGICNADDIRQLIRSSGSIAANYIEANEGLGRKDFLMRIKICRKEAKESQLWLRLLQVPSHLTEEQSRLVKEAREFVLIFTAIHKKCSVRFEH